jgi:ABC-type sugar transport system permease subunit
VDNSSNNTAAVKSANGKKHLSLIQKRAVTGFLFVLPWFLGFLLFYIRSIFMTVQFSLSNVSLGDSKGYKTDWVGLKNYIYAFTEDPKFTQTLVSSIGDILIDVPLVIFFSLFMAILLNKKFKGRTVVRAIFFLPVILNAGAVLQCIETARAAVVSGSMSNVSTEIVTATTSATSGINLDYFLAIFEDLGLPAKLVTYIAGAASRIQDIITMSGVQIVIFIAALQSIPGSMYEVAQIEGATAYETFWKVTFPMVTPLIITNIVYTVVDSFATSEVIELARTTAFEGAKDYGLSSAMSLVSTFVICLILIVVCGLIQRKTFYYN